MRAISFIRLFPSLVILSAASAWADGPVTLTFKSGDVKEVVVDAPAGAKPEVKGDNGHVLGGAHFELGIVAAKPADLKRERDAVMKGKPKVDSDTATLFAWNHEVLGEQVYEFISLVTVGKATFMCCSSTLDDQRFTKADVDAMIKACKSLQKK